MNIIFFSHPTFMKHQSMPRFVRMLEEGMHQRGHQTEIWTSKAFAHRLPFSKRIKKWLGYFDQYILFPFQISWRLRKKRGNTLFVFTDHALGPWVPLVAKRPHVIHCHDFLAQRAALKEIRENVTSWTGRKYQLLIRKGYSKGKNFISVSKKTKEDLHRFLPVIPGISTVIYNGLNNNFGPMNVQEVRKELFDHTGIDFTQGYVLHVGGNQWYKNRIGVIEIYDHWRSKYGTQIPLILIGQRPDNYTEKVWKNASHREDIYVLDSFSDEWVKKAYAGASVFLFPSLAEGFGWPIAEAMASGCPVITTNEAPMTEVAQDAGFYIPKKPLHPGEIKIWLEVAANVLEKVLVLTSKHRKIVIENGFKNAGRFNSQKAIDKIEEIYLDIIKSEK